MRWIGYEVVLRLRSPMHIGCGKVGNLQRTRGYVLGRVLWGALTMRLTRDLTPSGQPATDSIIYRQIGERVHQSMAYTYFYPALKKGDVYQIAWPWQEDFATRFLGSYAATALTYPEQSAEEGSLHEVEFISPFTTDTGEPVFLLGYVLAKNEAPDWQSALRRIQFGGERCYGWGRVEPVQLTELPIPSPIFGGVAIIKASPEGRPLVRLDASTEKPSRLLAHTRFDRLPARGTIEPLVGREWRSDKADNEYAGQHVEFCGIHFQPGSLLLEAKAFQIGNFGLWKMTDGAS